MRFAPVECAPGADRNWFSGDAGRVALNYWEVKVGELAPDLLCLRRGGMGYLNDEKTAVNGI